MIAYSIKKPHALCGHSIYIKDTQEYKEMRAIAEGCGFIMHGTSLGFFYYFQSDKTCSYQGNLHGQQVTMSELRQLAELSKIELPCEMEVSDDEIVWPRYTVIGFYKGQAVIVDSAGTYITYKHFRVDPKSKRKSELVKIIDDAKKELEEIEEAKV